MKKVIKIIGNLLMVAAVVFIVKKFMDMDVNISQFGSAAVIAALVISFAVQTAILVMGTYPWLVFVKALSGRSIPFSAAMPVYTQSNLYKYVPGNVFQYVGRNKLAADMDISHVDEVSPVDTAERISQRALKLRHGFAVELISFKSVYHLHPVPALCIQYVFL